MVFLRNLRHLLVQPLDSFHYSPRVIGPRPSSRVTGASNSTVCGLWSSLHPRKPQRPHLSPQQLPGRITEAVVPGMVLGGRGEPGAGGHEDGHHSPAGEVELVLRV